MPPAKRPAKSVPKPKAPKPKDNFSVAFTVDAKPYAFDLKHCTGLDVNICRRSCGYGPIELIRMLQSGSADIDVLAAIAWMSRRQNGEPRLSFEEVASEFDYDVALEVVNTEEVESPE